MQATLGAERERMATRAVSAATIGTALEWFDFTLYGAVSATVLPKLFFPTMDATPALLASLATFGVGLGARPLGAIICGQLGDKLGRRNLLLATVTVMGLASVLIGCCRPMRASASGRRFCSSRCASFRALRSAANRPARN